MYKKILYYTLLVFLLYFAFNFSYLIKSKKIHDMVLRQDISNKEMEAYIKETASIRIRGCTLPAKIISLSCNELISSWALGEVMNNALNEKLNK